MARGESGGTWKRKSSQFPPLSPATLLVEEELQRVGGTLGSGESWAFIRVGLRFRPICGQWVPQMENTAFSFSIFTCPRDLRIRVHLGSKDSEICMERSTAKAPITIQRLYSTAKTPITIQRFYIYSLCFPWGLSLISFRALGLEAVKDVVPALRKKPMIDLGKKRACVKPQQTG